MKKMTCVVLMLCIAMMCTTPFEAQSQNRRTGGGNSGNATKKEQSAATKSSNSAAKGSSTTPTRTGSSGSSNSSVSRSSEPRTKMVTPSGQTRQSNATKPSSTTRQSNAKSSAPSTRNSAPAQVQDRRSTRVTTSNSNSHSAQISRKNSDVGRQNIPAPKSERSVRSNPPREHRPDAIQYHNEPPRPRGPEFSRPFLEPRHAPIPSYRYGNHYFGHRLNVLPRGYVTMRIGGLDYYYYDGIYYRPYRLGGYYVVRPPRGTAIASTLFNVALTAIAINTIRNEVERAQRAAELSRVYSTRNTGYVVRTSDDYYNANLLGQTNQDYYYQDGVFYILKNGQYYVIEPPIGALVTEIPNDYDEIELEGRTYYLVEDTLYKTTVIDGALYFEVVSNL
jgi:hypothetical protein